MKQHTESPDRPNKFFNFFHKHPWRSAIAALLALVVIATTIGSQIIQTHLSADSFKNELQQHAAQYLADANSYINKGDFTRAMDSVRLFLDLYPDNEEGYLARASIYAGKGQYKRAISDMDHLIEISPDSAEYYLQRGCLYILLNDYDSAQADFDQAITLDDTNQELLLLIAQIYCEKEDYPSALTIYDRYLLAYPDSAEIYAQEAYLYSLSEDYTNAADKLRSAYDIAPSYEYSSALAQTYAAAGNYEETINFCQISLEEDDSDDSLYQLLADAYYLQADYANAAQAYETFLTRSPKEEESAFQLCICYLQLNQLDQALSAAKELLTYATDENILKNAQDIVDYLQSTSS
ncbi:MAG: tetratricopeptide repeat protein [Hespellia sp.]|nr:tetratricopeptide repeat protein [Hespellia sp.]